MYLLVFEYEGGYTNVFAELECIPQAEEGCSLVLVKAIISDIF